MSRTNQGLDLYNCVPQRNGAYMADTVPKYKYVITIDANAIHLKQLKFIEEWCNEAFGEMNECSTHSPWQLTYSEDRNNGTNNHFLHFHFHNEQFAMAFKLTWS